MTHTRKLFEFVADSWLEGEAICEADVRIAWDRWRIARAEQLKSPPLVAASWVETQELERAIARLGGGGAAK